MGSRRATPRRTERDDQVETAGRAAASTATSSRSVGDHLLNMQREYGNAAVTDVVQRREHAASTDAPGYKAPKAAKKVKEEPKADFAPTGHSQDSGIAADTPASLNARALEASRHPDVLNSLTWARDAYEEVWFQALNLGDRRGAALNVYRSYMALVTYYTAAIARNPTGENAARYKKNLADSQARADFWAGMQHEQPKKDAPPPGSMEHA